MAPESLNNVAVSGVQNEILKLGNRYLMSTYARFPIVPVRGEGCLVWDADGRQYLDFVGGLAVNSLGHCHPGVVEAVRAQAGMLLHCSNLYWIESQVKLARLLVENSALDRVFFGNSGAEANEAAIKLARKYAHKRYGPDRYEIITFNQSFHGRTLATLAATAQEKLQQGFEPLPEGFKHVPFNDFTAFKAAVNNRTCAVMLEPVQGEGGVNVAGAEFLGWVTDLCQERGLLLILDEIQCGLGRTGRLFAYEHYGIKPDMVTLAKALGGGVPIGALLAREEVAESFNPGDHGSTFGGNPLACAAGVAAFTAILKEKLPDQAATLGGYFKQKLTELARSYSFIREVRGLGLILGMELSLPGAPVVEACLKRGLLINCTNRTVLRFLPPLTVGRLEVDKALAILAEALAEVEPCPLQ